MLVSCLVNAHIKAVISRWTSLLQKKNHSHYRVKNESKSLHITGWTKHWGLNKHLILDQFTYLVLTDLAVFRAVNCVMNTSVLVNSGMMSRITSSIRDMFLNFALCLSWRTLLMLRSRKMEFFWANVRSLWDIGLMGVFDPSDAFCCKKEKRKI